MGQMTGWELGKSNSNICGNCGMKVNKQQQKDCCNEEQKFVKENSDQNITEPLFLAQQNVAVALTTGFVDINRVAFYSFMPRKHINVSAHRSRNVALYLSNRVFRI